MTGMERNADVVKLAAFAPLLQNANDSAAGGGMCPTSMVMYDNHRCVKKVEPLLQVLLAVALCSLGGLEQKCVASARVVWMKWRPFEICLSDLDKANGHCEMAIDVSHHIL